MIEIRNVKELKEFRNSGSLDDIQGICEICGKSLSLKIWSIRRKLKKDKLLCKGCSISYEKGKYTKEDTKLITEKRSKTNLEKYGIENTWQLEKVKRMSSERDWTERNINTQKSCIIKYGVTNPAQTEESKEKSHETLLKRYGTVEASYKIRMENSKGTYMKHYGVDHNFKSKEWRREANEIIIKKYGRMIYSRTYVYNEVCFDSSWELAYYIWLTDNKQNFTYQPITDFTYLGSDGISHKYHPDFLVEGEYQEIKGNQFFNKEGEPYCAITKSWWKEKYNFIQENKVKLLKYNDLFPILKYIEKVYGKSYLKSFKIKIK